MLGRRILKFISLYQIYYKGKIENIMVKIAVKMLKLDKRVYFFMVKLISMQIITVIRGV